MNTPEVKRTGRPVVKTWEQSVISLIPIITLGIPMLLFYIWLAKKKH